MVSSLSRRAAALFSTLKLWRRAAACLFSSLTAGSPPAQERRHLLVLGHLHGCAAHGRLCPLFFRENRHGGERAFSSSHTFFIPLSRADTCAICRNKLYEPSIEAQANPGLADDAGYSIAWGCCGHVFHLDCISRWLKTRSVCPLCNREWEFAKIEKIATYGNLD